MKRTCVLGALGAVALFACSANANAQGNYLSLHGGISIPKNSVSEFDSPGLPGGFGTITTDADNGYRFGGAFGYAFSKYLSAEVELSYTHNDLNSLSVVSFAFPAGTGPIPAKGSASTFNGMINGYLSLPVNQFRPYVGAGIGYSQVSANGTGFAGVPGGTDNSAGAFSWQIMAGVGFKLSPGVELGARYRFHHIDGYSLFASNGDEQRVRDSEGQSFELTLTWSFPAK